MLYDTVMRPNNTMIVDTAREWNAERPECRTIRSSRGL